MSHRGKCWWLQWCRQVPLWTCHSAHQGPVGGDSLATPPLDIPPRSVSPPSPLFFLSPWGPSEPSSLSREQLCNFCHPEPQVTAKVFVYRSVHCSVKSFITYCKQCHIKHCPRRFWYTMFFLIHISTTSKSTSIKQRFNRSYDKSRLAPQTSATPPPPPPQCFQNYNLQHHHHPNAFKITTFLISI